MIKICGVLDEMELEWKLYYNKDDIRTLKLEH